MAERKKLNIIEVSPRQEVGANHIPKLSFKALNEKDQENNYQTFRTSLFEIIEKKGTIDCEIEIKETADYTNRNITQIYIDGQPVGGQKKGYQKYENTASIEAQCAFKGIMTLAAAFAPVPGQMPREIHDMLTKALAWADSKLNPPVKVPLKTPSEVVTKKSDPVKKEKEEDTEHKANVDPDWLKETLTIIKWTEKTCLSWIKANLKIETQDKLPDTLKGMNAEQLQKFVSKLQNMRDASGQ